MVTHVIKRDGKKVAFDKSKIETSILKAYAVYHDVDDKAREFALKVATDINEMNVDTLSIEEIQDIVEKKLMGSSHKDVAKVYINYRYLKSMARSQYTELWEALADKLSAKNVQNQNANVDEHSFGGRIGEASSVMTKRYALEFLVSPMAKANHENNEIYIHDLDAYAVGSHNCMSIPFDDLLAKGFNTRQTDVRPAQSVNTAFQLLAVIFQLQSLQQFGGVSATHLDWTMVPYVRKSFYKHYIDGLKYFHHNVKTLATSETPIEEKEYKKHKKAYNYATDQTVKEVYQAVEGMYHNLNTLQSRSGNQLPFTSINYGTCTLPEGRLIIKALLDTSIKGLGKLHKTSIFPCGIFQYWKGVNDRPGTPNYDMYRLALKSTALRLYPNYANVDWSGNAGFDPADPKTYFSTMGALDGNEHLYVRVNDGNPQDVTIKELFELCDKVAGRPASVVYTKAKLNLPGKTRKIQDHSQATCDKKAGVYRITYLPQDVSYIGSSSNIQQRWREHKVSIRTSGGCDCGIKFNDPQVDNYLFEVLEYTDDYKTREEYYIMHEPNINVRGTSKKYYKLSSRKYDPIYERPVFKYNLSAPQELISLEEFNIKVLDINNNWTKVRHIFKNDKLNTPLMMHIRYKEFDREFELSCTEDHPLWTGESFTRADRLEVGDCLYRADGLELPITQISWHWEAVDSYDIGTETGTFIGSDIMMHNCRTANGLDINAEPGVNPQTKDGRGNICPMTIIMPTLAMEAREIVFQKEGKEGLTNESLIVSEFMTLLDQKIHEAKDMLIERFNWIAAQSAESAKFMYENNVMLGYHPEEGIRSALRHGTIVIGQLGLAETLQLLVGCDHTEQRGMELAKKIEQLFKQRCAEFKQEYKLNFGVYFTPAENLCFTAMKKFKDKYGVIENVSDREYFTNSMHVPVWKNVDPFEKIDIESQLTSYSSAGCITYVELDASCKHNIDALEKIVNYAMDKDIPYFAVNVPNDTCLDCGFTGEFNDECPECGSKHIQQLRRVTGYLTGDFRTAFNSGKQAEVEQRVKHNKTITGDC